jgi:hypothetical protein
LIAVPFERQEALGERTTFSEEEGAARAAQLQAGAGAGGIGPPPH